MTKDILTSGDNRICITCKAPFKASNFELDCENCSEKFVKNLFKNAVKQGTFIVKDDGTTEIINPEDFFK